MTTAILDFGTNTFNLLIAERKQRAFNILHTSRQPVKLGKGGIESNRITPDAFERGFVAVQNLMETITRYDVDEIRAFGTSAIRNAANGEDFVEEVYQKFGFRPRIISGDREAELIYKGVRQAIPMDDRNVLILDIGGGSNEFIICNRGGIVWKHSFEMGIARVLELFTLSDPIRTEEIRALESYFMDGLALLLEAVGRTKPHTLIGASGSFDTFYDLISHRLGLEPDKDHGREIPMIEYTRLHNLLLLSNTEQRKKMPGMEPVRVEMIVAATIFVNFVIRACHIGHLYHSEFSLKEGVISELVGL